MKFLGWLDKTAPAEELARQIREAIEQHELEQQELERQELEQRGPEQESPEQRERQQPKKRPAEGDRQS